MFSYFAIASIGFVCGVYLVDLLPMLKALEIAAVAVIISGFFLLFLRSHKSRLLILLGFLLLGIFGSAHTTDYKNNSLHPLEGKYVTLSGYISDIPDQNGELYSYKLTLSGAEYLGTGYDSSQTVRMTSYEKLAFGDEVEAKGFLQRFSDRKNSTDFNTRRYYQSRGIFYKLYARELSVSGTTSPKLTANYMATALKNKLHNIIDAEFSGDDAAILKAVSTGNKHRFSAEYKALLMRTGIIKYFYSAFFHVSLIMLVIGIIFGACKKSTRDALLAAAMLLYATVNSSSPVFVKCSLMVILAILAQKRLGFSHKPDLLAITALAISLCNPLYCFDAGFIMSVSCSIIFYYFYDILLDKLHILPFGRRFAAFYIISTFMMLPVAAYLFNVLQPYTNLFTPIFSVTVALLLILLPIMIIFIKLFGGALFLKPVISFLILPFEKLPHFIDALPNSHIYLKTPSVAVIAATICFYYVIYRFSVSGMLKQSGVTAAVICLGLWCGIGVNHCISLGNMDITFVNVGQGDGAVVKVDGGETIIIDGGGKYEFSDYDEGENTFLPYLIDNGHTKLDVAVISHFHSDHVLGVIAAIKALKVGEIIMPDTKDAHRTEIERLAYEKGIPIRTVAAGDVIDLPSGLRLNVISAADSASADPNEGSLVIKLEYGGFSCLFTGDIGAETEHRIQSLVGDVDVVKMAHHGSANSNSPEFANAITAEYAVVSVGENNIYGFPKEDAIYNYQQSGARIVPTDTNGDITLRVNRNGEYSIFKNSIY